MTTWLPTTFCLDHKACLTTHISFFKIKLINSLPEHGISHKAIVVSLRIANFHKKQTFIETTLLPQKIENLFINFKINAEKNKLNNKKNPIYDIFFCGH